MLNDYTGTSRIYLACGYTDLRRGIDGLAEIVTSKFKLDPFDSSLFLFCGRRCDRIKALYWEGDGFLLLYKRLERGRGQRIDAAPIQMADGGAGGGTIESLEAGKRSAFEIVKKSVKTLENTGFPR